ncbi:FG-GAP repeat domain-containing protein (plasmid) [Haloferax sp. S1W]|uniref:FG-GAP repeat domain-containing protein n=1 Tax=Haloferax sp. S1W TaxID=3377110 RepID=UPI0037C58060
MDPRRKPTDRIEFLDSLPLPSGVSADSISETTIPLSGSLDPEWNSVALFFNLSPANQPGGYSQTNPQDVSGWLNEKEGPSSADVSEFMGEYYRAVSYGNLAFGIDTPRDDAGDPLIPTLTGSNIDPGNWHQLINRCLDANAERIWKAAGELTKDGDRWIPSVFLVQNYGHGAHANYGGFTRTVDGKTYRIGDRLHVRYDGSWRVLSHEYAHNFLEFGDLYGPQGSTLFWDILGNAGGSGNMSEASSVHKERVGWLEFKEVIEGPSVSTRTLSLKPYTTTGEAYKVVPDPENNPHEYFVLEYRKSTGSEAWRPDGDLTDEGLLVTHINDRLGIPHNWLLRDAPYFDPEYAGASDKGTTSRKGGSDATDIFYPQPDNDAFTPDTMPESDFYGGRPSGLRIQNVRIVDGEVTFELGIWGAPLERVWHTSPAEPEIQIEEETSDDSETGHVTEEVGFLAFQRGTILDATGVAIGETGVLSTRQSGDSQWHTVHLDGDYLYPVVVAQLTSYEGSDPAHARVRRVSSDSFEVQIEEWDYDNQAHTEEEIEYAVFESGTHRLAGGTTLEAGVVETDHNWKTVSFDETVDNPIVVSRSQTHEGEQAIVTRHRNVVSDGFDVRLQEEEANNDLHRTEDIGYVALDAGPGGTHLAGRASIDDQWSRLNFDEDFDAPPVTLASIQTFRGGDTAGLRLREPETNDRTLAGRFTSADTTKPEEIFIRDDDRAALLQTHDSQWFAVHRHDDQIDEWNLRPQDREVVGDLDGDGRDEIYIRSDNRAGVIEWGGREFITRTLTNDRIGEWNLRPQDREVVGDLDGDGKDEIYVRSNDWAGVVALENGDLTLRSIQHDRIGEWDLRAQDKEYVGRFSQTEHDEVVVRSNDWIGLLQWDDTAEEMRCEYLTSGRVDEWNLGADDEHVIGDFDGDGKDEIYIRSDNWAGVMKWKNGEFTLLWIRDDDVQNMGNGPAIDLKATDESYAGRFLPNPVWSSDSDLSERPPRDGVLHVSGSGSDTRLSILTWENGAMKVRHHKNGGQIEWTDGGNHITIGDFHPRGPDPVRENRDFQGDRADDVFVHNAWGTGMIGINYVEFAPTHRRWGGNIKEQMSITWKQREYLLARSDSEDCLSIDSDSLTVESYDGGATLRDDDSLILQDDDEWVIERAKKIFDHYGFDHHCLVGRPYASMQYFLVDGAAPEGPMPNESGVTFDADNLAVTRTGGGWAVEAGGRELVTCPNRNEAHQAFAVIQDYGFTKKCWVEEPDGPMTYFRR